MGFLITLSLIALTRQLGKISEIGDLKVGEDEIKRVRKTKYLGLTIFVEFLST